ncbi:MAG: FAD-dependent oxidoreductase [Dongiaceae bacterium]
MTDTLTLAYSLGFADLYDPAGLARIDALFCEHLGAANQDLAAALATARGNPTALENKAESDLLIAIAPHLDDFLGRLFDIEAPLRALSEKHTELAPLFACKRLFVQRRATRAYKEDVARELDGPSIQIELEKLFGEKLTEQSFARHVMAWSADEKANDAALDLAARYAAWVLHSDAGRAKHRKGVLFKVPHKVDLEHLVPVKTAEHHPAKALELPPALLRHREGFALTDAGTDLVGALDQAHYCIFCHNQGKDSCSKGYREKDGSFRKTMFGVTLAGCPLEEKISEMHVLKTDGVVIGSLAVAVVDNPMIAGTGHRICNDCMKACIYQKQDPVDIPQAETRTLKDVLELPWGFEIYSLLTRWNPLNLREPVAKPHSGRRVLIAGLGPAGFTLSHYLLNQGHTVIAVDGLKIEPLPADISGVKPDGSRVAFKPIRDVNELYENLDARVMAGFGGVAEYGITVRWNKNFLKLIRLLLERRASFAMYGGVRFGGTITTEQAFQRGFDHVALALGAGKPTILDLPNGLAPGVRAASDFLMALQLTGAARRDSIANLQIRLPVVVIGGGLTAIDTATEAMAYYPVQVEKFLKRYETLIAERGEKAVRARWLPVEAEIASEFLDHARAIRQERARAEAAGEAPNIRALIDRWGGITLAYRRRMIDSPSYTLNHEEVHKALEEGIRFAEELTPEEVEIDAAGVASAVRFRQGQDIPVTLPARAVLVAAGTRPNTVLAREDALHYAIDGKFFRLVDEKGAQVEPEWSAKPGEVHVLHALREDGRAVSFFGDLHPSWAGNVVKAMASAKQGWPVVQQMLDALPAAPANDRDDFIAACNRDFRARVHQVNRLTPGIIEVVVQAPAAARNFKPGEFYRLQNFETLAPRTADTVLGMEGLAMTGAWVDREQGLVSIIALEMGGSSDLCALLKEGEPVILMGPTGHPTEIPEGETVLLAGGGLGNAVLFSIGKALRQAGSRVLYFAGYKKLVDRYKVADIEAASDVVIWTTDEAPGFKPSRDGDLSHVGNIVEAMRDYAEGKLGPTPIRLHDVDRIIAIGSDGMMSAVQQARHGVLAPYLKPSHAAIGSINSPMQCMMKEICAQCLQPWIDPETGQETVVFSCFNQDQPLDRVDFKGLRKRLTQNGVQEKLTAQWIDRCLVQLGRRERAA